MSMIRYTPYSVAGLQQQLNRIFDQFDPELTGRSEELGGGMFTPAADVKEDTDAYIVQVEVPGIAQDSINITLQENVLTIRGEKAAKQDNTEGQFRRVERAYGLFARSLSLPRGIDSNGVTASLRDGVLEVRLPKQEEAKPRQINIGVTHDGK
jgi:HSP20 family protein